MGLLSMIRACFRADQMPTQERHSRTFRSFFGRRSATRAAAAASARREKEVRRSVEKLKRLNEDLGRNSSDLRVQQRALTKRNAALKEVIHRLQEESLELRREYRQHYIDDMECAHVHGRHKVTLLVDDDEQPWGPSGHDRALKTPK